MPQYNVFLYPVMRVKVEAVEAATPEEAITKAEATIEQEGGYDALVAPARFTLQHEGVAEGVTCVDYDESTTGDALVEDAEGHEKFSCWYESEHNGDSFPWRPKG